MDRRHACVGVDVEDAVGTESSPRAMLTVGMARLRRHSSSTREALDETHQRPGEHDDGVHVLGPHHLVRGRCLVPRRRPVRRGDRRRSRGRCRRARGPHPRCPRQRPLHIDLRSRRPSRRSSDCFGSFAGSASFWIVRRQPSFKHGLPPHTPAYCTGGRQQQLRRSSTCLCALRQRMSSARGQRKAPIVLARWLWWAHRGCCKSPATQLSSRHREPECVVPPLQEVHSIPPSPRGASRRNHTPRAFGFLFPPAPSASSSDRSPKSGRARFALASDV